MDILKNKRPDLTELGEILVVSGIIEPARLPEALKIGKQANMPLGRVLVMIEALSEQQLELALQVQSLIKAGCVPGKTGIAALQMSSQCDMTIQESLKQIGFDVLGQATRTSQLGELLILAGAITRTQLVDALHNTEDEQITLGRFLVINRILSPLLLTAALKFQVLMRDKKITRAQAIEGLRLMMQKRSTLDQALTMQGIIIERNPNEICLGEMLVSAGAITEADVLTALEWGLLRDEPIGQILIQAGLIREFSLDAALYLQLMINYGLITNTQAAEILQKVINDSVSVRQLLCELPSLQGQDQKNAAVLDLLKISGLVTPKDIQRAELSSSPAFNAMALIEAAVIDGNLFYSASQCWQMIQDGILKTEQAIIALNYCARSRVTVQEAFDELAWDIKSQKTVSI